MKYIDVKQNIYEIMLEKLVNNVDIYDSLKDGTLTDYADEIGQIAFDLAVLFAKWGFIDDNSDSQEAA